MSVQLLIRDGSPDWYLSPDIWVVPGTDPTGPAGPPVAGQPAYLWAHVANTGTEDVTGVQVQFYWANPALQVLRSTATLVGTATADIPAGGSQDVLCLVPWIPVMVNLGHECLVVQAISPSDPLPNPLPDDFDPPAYRQVAQKNLTVLPATMMSIMHTITLSATKRADKAVTVSAEVGGTLDRLSLERLGLHNAKPTKNGVVEVGLTTQPHCAGEKGHLGEAKLQLRVPKGEQRAVYASVRAKSLGPDEYQLVRITERAGDKLLGGLAFVAVSDKKEKQS